MKIKKNEYKNKYSSGIFQRFRDIYLRLDDIIVEHDNGGFFPFEKDEDLGEEYVELMQEANQIEAYIRHNYPAADLEYQIKLMKAGYTDEEEEAWRERKRQLNMK